MEIDTLGNPVRIYRNQKGYLAYGIHAVLMDRSKAVSAIRKQVWDLTNGECVWCSNPITEASMHLHEIVPRGQGGEISLENSTGLCAECHITGPDAAHSNRKPRFRGKLDV